MRAFSIKYLLFGLTGTGLALLLDKAAAFSFVTYVPLYFFSFGYALWGLRSVFVHSRTARIKTLAEWMIVVTATLIVILSMVLPRIETSERKKFHLMAETLEPGASLLEIERQMATYERFEGNGFVSFAFRASAHAEDRVIIDLNEDGTAKSVEIVTN